MVARDPMAAIAVGRGLIKRPPDRANIGMCLREIRELYNVPSRYRTAAAACAATKLHGRGPAPAGALHWWIGGSSGAGHVALGVTPVRVISTDNVRAGALDLVTLDRIRRTWGNLHYEGWSRDINDVEVLPLVQLEHAMDAPAAVAIVTRALAEEGLLPLRLAGDQWTPEVVIGYARWQERAGLGKATPGKTGPADGLVGIKSLTMLGMRRGFAASG